MDNQLVEHIAEDILDMNNLEKVAYEREKRIKAYKDYFSKDEYQGQKMNRDLDRSEGRAYRADLKQKIRMADSPEAKAKLKQQLKKQKAVRNDRIISQVGDDLNPVLAIKSGWNAITATAKTPHNLLLSTPGQYYDAKAAKQLAERDLVRKRDSRRKHASERDELVEKVACEIVEIALER